METKFDSGKPTNPKDAIGSTKLPMGLVPDTIVAEASIAFLEGALKYGRCNWRVAGVSASIYHDALGRHLSKWWNGQDSDPKTRVKHLASVIACAGIILDAELCGKLNDDRPPVAPMDTLIDNHEETVKHLKELFKDHHPKQYTIADSEEKKPKKVYTWEGVVLNPQPTPQSVTDFNTATFGPPILLEDSLS